MKGHGEKITRKQSEAIAALLECQTVSEAARKTGIGETTLWRWMKRDKFRSAYGEAKRSLVDSAINRLSAASSGAVDTLVDVMKDKDSPANSRVSAAKSILDTSIKVIEIESLENRISVLEKSLDRRK
jgi:transposase-like protein